MIEKMVCTLQTETYVPADSVAIVIPAFNEGRNIGDTLTEIRQVLPRANIVVVDDGSEDDTARVSAERGATVLSSPTNLGYSSAIQIGLRYALNKGYDYAITIDADGQHNPRYIPQMLSQLLTTPCDIVIASRWKLRHSCEKSCVRTLGMWALSRIVCWATKQQLTDTSSGFQAYSRSGMAALACSELPVRNPDADVVVYLAKKGIVFTEVPVQMRPRRQGRGMNEGVIRMFRYGYQVLIALLAQLLYPQG